MRLKYAAPAREERLQTKPAEALYVALENVESWSGRLLLDHPMDVVEGGVTRFRTGDVLVGKLRPYLAKVARPTFDGVCSTEFVVLRPTSRLLAEFLQYQLLTAEFIGEMSSWTFGTKMPRVSPERMLKTEVMFPSIEEQWAIVGYLDKETSRIDSLINYKNQLLDACERFFDGLIEHLIQPRDRPCERLKQVSGGITVGVVVNPSTYVEEQGEVLFFRGVDISRFSVNVETAQRISVESSQRLHKSRLNAGDIVSIRVGDPGISAVVPGEADGSNCASLLITRKGARVDSRYLCYVFNSPYGRSQWRALANGAAQLQVNVSDAVDFRVPLPSTVSQREIVNRLDAEWRSIRALKAAVRSQTDLLREQRQTLITAAITGQIDVRGVA